MAERPFISSPRNWTEHVRTTKTNTFSHPAKRPRPHARPSKPLLPLYVLPIPAPRIENSNLHTLADAPEKIPYAINRYQTETRRLYSVLNDRLASQRAAFALPASQPAFLVANKYSAADICVFSWANWGEWAGVDPCEAAFPEVKVWLEAIEKRAAVEKGTNVPDEFKMKEIMRSKEKSEEYAKHSSGWIMKGMKEEEGKGKM